MRRMLTMGTVHFQARAAAALHARLLESAELAQVPWYVAIDVLKRRLLAVCREAATLEMRAMAGWMPEQWAEQAEVREARRAPEPITPC